MRSRSRKPLSLEGTEPADPGADVAVVEAAEAEPVLSATTDAGALPQTTPAEPELSIALTAPHIAPEKRGGRAAYPLAIIAALLWVGGVAAYAAYQIGGGALDATPVNLALLGLVALAPAGLALLVAHLVRQAADLALEARRARSMADALGLPTGLAARDSSLSLISLRSDIELSTQAAVNARTELAALRTAMEEETRRLNEAAESAQRSARKLADQLSKERSSLIDVGVKLETQAQDVIGAVERQARMVADASDLAQTQLREAEAALAARAADMASAAGEAQDAARTAADDLARQTIRLETAGTGVADQIRAVEEGLSEQRASLVQAAFGLRRDQEDFSAQVETQRAQLTESLGHSRLASSEMNESANQNAASLQKLVEAASDQVKALSELAGSEAETFDVRTREALNRFEDLSAQVRETAIQESERTLARMQTAMEDQRKTSEAAVLEARARVDRLNESAFEAGKVADQAIETRLRASRRSIEETAALGEEAGQQMAERLEASLSTARGVLDQMTAALAELDDRARRMPVEARARIDEVRDAVEKSLTALSDSSRRIAQETETADAAFHDRVVRNYDMLSEAVRLMGVVSGEGQPAPAPRREPMAPPPAPETTGDGLRGRLRLTPTDKDVAVREAFQPREAPPATDFEVPDRPWREMLSGERAVEAEPASEADASALASQVNGAIRDLGVDPNALLPRSRVEEAVEAWRAGDQDRARGVARNVAPAAVRRISRRVMTDPDLKKQVERYVRHYAGTLRKAGGEEVAALLQSDTGRAFLLIDASVGEG